MQLSQIRLESQTTQIHITQLAGKQDRTQPRVEFSIQEPKASFSIRTRPGIFTIDQTKAWEDMNLYSPLWSVEIAAEEGNVSLMEGIQRRVQQGAKLMAIESGDNPIANQSSVNGYGQMKSLGIKYIPSHFSVQIDYQPARVEIGIQWNNPVINVKISRSEHNYHAGSVYI